MNTDSNQNQPKADATLDFNFPVAPPRIIKAVGVGGGGGNAVTHMFRQGIEGVTFALCNTDKAALIESPVPVHVQLGDGLGAGGRPEVGRQKAEESEEKIRAMLNDGTRMVFLTAGMGGGTGTGASPVIARISRQMGILTVGIVTIPFKWEGIKQIDKALDGVEALANEVDALLIINNEQLRVVYQNYTVLQAFAMADDTLTVAASSIVELIGRTGHVNLDFEDVYNVLKDGGAAIISTGYGEGEHRLATAINAAVNSPLLNDNDIFYAQKIIINIYTSDDPSATLNIYELEELERFMNRFKTQYESKPGITVDPSLGAKVKVTILASGFGLKRLPTATDQPSAQEQQRLADRRDLYYPSQGNNRPGKRRHNVFVFSDAALDDDNLIEQVAQSATGQRSRAVLSALDAEAAGPTPAARPDDDIIAFEP